MTIDTTARPRRKTSPISESSMPLLSPVLVAQVAQHARPQEDEGQPALALGEHDVLPAVAARLAYDELEPAFEGDHVFGPARRGPQERPREIHAQPESLPRRHRPRPRVDARAFRN